jgi:uncharacterized protein (TIGR00730 family)
MSAKPQKSYKNLKFINSPEARIIRILSEFIEPKSRFDKYRIENAIVFFGSARLQSTKAVNKALKGKNLSAAERDQLLRLKKLAPYYDHAFDLAEKLTEWSQKEYPGQYAFPVMTGGGPGIMEAANKGASQVPHSVNIGLNISLPFEQDSNSHITDELNFEFHYFFTRKYWFLEMARVLVVFPGGFGTMDELFELLTLVQTQKTDKEVKIILFGKKFWREIIHFDKMVDYGLISARDLELFEIVDSPDEAQQSITRFLQQIDTTP